MDEKNLGKKAKVAKIGGHAYELSKKYHTVSAKSPLNESLYSVGNPALASSPMVNMEQIVEPPKVKILRLQSFLPSSHPTMAPLLNFVEEVNRKCSKVEIVLHEPNSLVPNE